MPGMQPDSGRRRSGAEAHLTRSGRLLQIRPVADDEAPPVFACRDSGAPHLVAEFEGQPIAWLGRHGLDHLHLCLHPDACGDGVATRLLALSRTDRAARCTVTVCQSEA